MTAPRKIDHPRRWMAASGVQLLRVGLLAAILGVIHWQSVRTVARSQARGLANVPLERVQALFPAAKKLGETESHGGLAVLDEQGQRLGYVIQTAPESDPYLGFSGPTNCLIGFDPAGRIAGVAIVSSRDTREHVDLIVRNAKFLKSWDRLTGPEAARRTDVDGVAGATLTSMAIAQGLQRRLGATPQTSKFPKELTVEDAKPLFRAAAAVQVDPDFANLWHVNDDRGLELGLILRTTPAADEVIGYQGPTETRIGIRAGGEIVGVAVGPSFDNQPYVNYVREDGYYLAIFRRLGLPQLAELDLKQAKIEGVTGATMTSSRAGHRQSRGRT
jgi:NosR/NirI family nitrous oxide reductase transcriptional regulator